MNEWIRGRRKKKIDNSLSHNIKYAQPNDSLLTQLLNSKKTNFEHWWLKLNILLFYRISHPKGKAN